MVDGAGTPIALRLIAEDGAPRAWEQGRALRQEIPALRVVAVPVVIVDVAVAAVVAMVPAAVVVVAVESVHRCRGFEILDPDAEDGDRAKGWMDLCAAGGSDGGRCRWQ
jgi:hypothetical protein